MDSTTVLARADQAEMSRAPGRPAAAAGRRAAHAVRMTEVVVAALAAGYGALFAVLDDVRDDYGISGSALGALIGVGYLASFATRITLAPLADRGRARVVVVAGLTLNVAGLLGMGLSRTIVPLLVARCAMGVGEGLALPAVQRIAVVGAEGNVGHHLGRLEAAEMVGFASGPAAVAVLAGRFGVGAPLLAIAALAAATLPFVARMKAHEAPREQGPRFAFDLLRQRSFVAAVAIGAGFYVTVGTFDALWSVTLDDVGAAAWIPDVGSVLLSVPLIAFASMGGRLSQRVGPFRTGTIGLCLAGAFMLSYGMVPSGGAMLAVAMVHWLSDGLTCSSRTIAVGLVVPASRQAGAQGVLGGIETLVAGLAAIGAGAVYAADGRTVAYAGCAAVAVVAAGFSVFLVRGDCRLHRLRAILSPTRAALMPGRLSPADREFALRLYRMCQPA